MVGSAGSLRMHIGDCLALDRLHASQEGRTIPIGHVLPAATSRLLSNQVLDGSKQHSGPMLHGYKLMHPMVMDREKPIMPVIFIGSRPAADWRMFCPSMPVFIKPDLVTRT